MLPTPEEIREAYDNLKKQTEIMYHSAENLANKKFFLEVEKAELLAAEKITGKNAEIREARLRLELDTNYAEVQRADLKYNNDKLHFRLAELEVSKLNLIIRLIE